MWCTDRCHEMLLVGVEVAQLAVAADEHSQQEAMPEAMS